MSDYSDGTVKLDELDNDKDLGICVDPLLKFSSHVNQKVNKANQIMGMIRRSYCYLDCTSFRYLFTSLVRPHIEYCNTAWYPALKKDMIRIESVLRRSSKLVNGLYDLTYEERLKSLKLPSMKYRFKRGDMIMVFKILHDKDNCMNSFFEINSDSVTRGHNLKLKKPLVVTSARKHFFSMRVINDWNDLPMDIVNAPSIETFKAKLDKFWNTHYYAFD